MSNVYRELNAVELQEWWATLFGSTAGTFTERALIQRKLDEGYLPVQILQGMLRFKRTEDVHPLVSRWLRDIDDWIYEDPMEAEAELVGLLMDSGYMPKEDFPACWYIYLDNLLPGGAPSATVEAKFQQAKKELGEWLNDKLGVASSQGGTERAPRRPKQSRRPAGNRPERLDR